MDISKYIENINNAIKFHFSIKYKRLDVNLMQLADIPNNLDFLYSQRFIHYLTFERALCFLTIVSKKMNPNAKIFISASGINSELSENYHHKDSEIEKRFCKLSLTMSGRHNILEPVCLYSKDDMSHLLNLSNFSPIKIWESDFGNIKAIAEISSI